MYVKPLLLLLLFFKHSKEMKYTEEEMNSERKITSLICS